MRLFHKDLEAYLVAEGLFDDQLTEGGWYLHHSCTYIKLTTMCICVYVYSTCIRVYIPVYFAYSAMTTFLLDYRI